MEVNVYMGRQLKKLLTTNQYGVQTYFFISKFNEIYMYKVIA